MYNISQYKAVITVNILIIKHSPFKQKYNTIVTNAKNMIHKLCKHHHSTYQWLQNSLSNIRSRYLIYIFHLLRIFVWGIQTYTYGIATNIRFLFYEYSFKVLSHFKVSPYIACKASHFDAKTQKTSYFGTK